MHEVPDLKTAMTQSFTVKLWVRMAGGFYCPGSLGSLQCSL